MIGDHGSLPVDLVPLVGRQVELDAVCRDLSGRRRLVTLTGPAGVGKTRLALEAATRLQRSKIADDGIWTIDISALQGQVSPQRLYGHLALMLGIQHLGTAGMDVLLNHLRGRRLLLVIDNCELRLPDIAEFATTILRHAPGVRILATSRERLGVVGEHNVVVPPLPLPEAISFFEIHASDAGVDGAALANRKAVEEACARLDGLPLALQMAAPLVRTLSIGQLLTALESSRFDLLADADAGTVHDARHRTLERAVDLSFSSCTAEERLVWTRASIFTQPFDLAAVQAVAGGAGVDNSRVFSVVNRLVSKSVFAVEHVGGAARYSMLLTLREYGQRELKEDVVRVRDQHAEYYCEVAASAAQNWLGPNEIAVLSTVHQNLPEILAAVDHLFAERHREGRLALARKLCRDVDRTRGPWFHGYLDLVDEATDRVLTASPAPRNDEEAHDLASTAAAAAWVAATRGRHKQARTLLALARTLLKQRDLGPNPVVLFAWGSILALNVGSSEAIGLLLGAREGFAGPEFVGDREVALMMLAIACALTGEPAEAAARCQEYVDEAEKIGAPRDLSWALWAAALGALRTGNHEKADRLIVDSARLQETMKDQWGRAWVIDLLAWIFAARLSHSADPHDEAMLAAWLLGAAAEIQDELGVHRPGLAPLAKLRSTAEAQVAVHLDKETFDAQLEAGRAGHAYALQVGLREPTTPSTEASAQDGVLSAREQQIAELVATGKTSIEIGAQLRISPRTVDSHVYNITKKLRVPNRTAIATYAGVHFREQAGHVSGRQRE
jgi:predicted ATPase/DNA-binding CsgD family transcriptional regulator